VRRGRVVEAVHLVHVASSDGLLRGDDVVSHLRSAAKPIQAVPLAEAYDDLGDDELAIACSSPQAEPAQLEAVAEGRLGHNCSGKHAGFLAACRANGWSLAGYRLPDHPLQQRIRALLGGGEPAVDGCGIPTYAQPLSAQARLLVQTEPRIADAMRARPELVGGRGADDTALMQLLPGVRREARRRGSALRGVAGRPRLRVQGRRRQRPRSASGRHARARRRRAREPAAAQQPRRGRRRDRARRARQAVKTFLPPIATSDR
jgi:L-asparaginase II